MVRAELLDNVENRWMMEQRDLDENATDQEKSECGCIVSIGFCGEIDIEYGFVKSSASDNAEDNDAADEEAEEDDSDDIDENEEPSSYTTLRLLRESLVDQLNIAAASVLETNPSMALGIIIAAIPCYTAPVDLVSCDVVDEENNFSEIFDKVRDLTVEKNLSNLALLAAKIIDIDTLDDSKDSLTLCNALDAFGFQQALENVFDAQEYFDQAPDAACLMAIRETCGADIAEKYANKKPVEIAAAARQLCFTDRMAQHLPLWLPPELRTANYRGTKAGEA